MSPGKRGGSNKRASAPKEEKWKALFLKEKESPPPKKGWEKQDHTCPPSPRPFFTKELEPDRK